MKREKIFTTTLIRNLREAGCSVYKLRDDVFMPGKRRVNIPNPCDIMGVLPGGRHISVEVKQSAASEVTGKPIAFGAALADHQREHMAHVHELGGCAVIALVSWRKREFWRLYLWTWGEFLGACGRKRQLYQHEMMEQPYLDRQRPAERGWDVSAHVQRWANNRPDGPESEKS